MAIEIGQFKTVTGRGVSVNVDGGVQIKLEHRRREGGAEVHEVISFVFDVDVAEAFETAIRVARRRVGR